MNAFYETSPSDRDADCASNAAHDAYGWREERAALLAELDAVRQEAETCARHRDELVSAIAHDLRGPLNSILGWVQLLQSGRLDSAQQTRALEAIVRGSTAQTRLIDSLLDVSRALRGKLQLSTSPLAVEAPLQAAIDAVIERAAAKNVEVKASIEPGITLNADVVRLRQVYDHLLENAVRCTPSGGTISIDVQQERGSVWIRVADTGIGIDREELPHVFEPFRRSEEPAGRSAGRGLGVGLALVREIIKLHGGRIDAHSMGRGRGALFTVRLPLSAQTTRPSRHDSAPAGPSNASHVESSDGMSQHERPPLSSEDLRAPHARTSHGRS